MEKIKKDKLWSKDFILLFLVNILAMIGFQMVNPNMAEYASVIGAKEAALGTVSAIFAVAALLVRPFSGKAADRVDCKKATIYSLLGATVSILMYTVSNSFGILLAVRFLHGVFFGLNTTLTMTMASRVLPDSRMGSGMGIFSLGQVFAMSIGPNIGIYIADSFGFNLMFITAASSSLISAVLVLFLKKQKPAAKEETGVKGPFWKAFFAPEAIGPSTIGLLNATAMGAINTFIVLHGRNRGVAEIGMFFMVNAITVLVARPFFSYFMDKVPIKRILYPCSLFIIGSMVSVGIADSLTVFLIGAVLFGMGNSGAQPALQTMCLKSVEFERRGAASGTYFIGLDLGNTFGPIMMSMMSSVYGFGNAFMSMAIPVALGIVVTFFTTRKYKPDKVVKAEG